MNMNSARRSINYIRNTSPSRNIKQSYNRNAHRQYMFIEDFSRLVPYTLSDDEFRIDIIGIEDDEKRIINTAFSRRGYINNDTTDSFREFINNTAFVLLAYGVSYHEIVFLKEEESSTFSIESIMYEKIREKRKELVITIPKSVAESHNCSSYIHIPIDDTCKFSYPKVLGGEKNRKILLTQLAELSKMSIMTESLHDEKSEFDPNVYGYKSDLLIAKVSKEIRWNARTHFDKRISEFYQLYRLIEFKKAQRKFLDYFIIEINAILLRLNEKLGFKGELVVEGKPTVEEFNNLKQRLITGDIDFIKLFNKINI
ncbi:hypothetical protein IZY60_13245 [Lutibacter sp. B2]|nr:hypothetical protein [Lutibacter sp. B2]